MGNIHMKLFYLNSYKWLRRRYLLKKKFMHDRWMHAQGVITIAHPETGHKHDTGNYRGISLTSNLGKLLTKSYITVFLNLLMSMTSYLRIKHDSRNSLAIQIIFTLKFIIETYKSQKKKNAAFIDLRNAFVTIWIEGLFYKISMTDIPTKVFQIIYSMYQNTKCRIKFSNRIGIILS